MSDVFKPLLPLDALIIREMPNEGTTFAGLYPLGESVSAIRKKLGGEIDSNKLIGRIRTLASAGLVVSVSQMGTGGTLGWQRTSKGQARLAEWEVILDA